VDLVSGIQARYSKIKKHSLVSLFLIGIFSQIIITWIRISADLTFDQPDVLLTGLSIGPWDNESMVYTKPAPVSFTKCGMYTTHWLDWMCCSKRDQGTGRVAVLCFFDPDRVCSFLPAEDIVKSQLGCFLYCGSFYSCYPIGRARVRRAFSSSRECAG
jgi:hypothetical protein